MYMGSNRACKSATAWSEDKRHFSALEQKNVFWCVLLPWRWKLRSGEAKQHDAEQLFRRALAGAEGELGPDHPKTLLSARCGEAAALRGVVKGLESRV